ncbi:hypothetical protein [Marinobacter sp. ANT_B65]|nr:hypothetical protein [Marinobacter sp. ANT_B65]
MIIWPMMGNHTNHHRLWAVANGDQIANPKLQGARAERADWCEARFREE